MVPTWGNNTGDGTDVSLPPEASGVSQSLRRESSRYFKFKFLEDPEMEDASMRTPWEPDDLHIATLNEVLAFLDSSGDSSLSRDGNSNDAIASGGLDVVDSDTPAPVKDRSDTEQQQETSSESKKAKKSDDERPKRPPRQRTNRKRLRPEILQLRQLIVDLEARLTCLQRIRERGGAQPVSVSSMMHIAPGQPDAAANAFENAVEEFKQLQRAQQRNLELRKALIEQAAMHEELQSLFAQNLSPEDLEFLCAIPQEEILARMLDGEHAYMHQKAQLFESKIMLLLWVSSMVAAIGESKFISRIIKRCALHDLASHCNSDSLRDLRDCVF
ncbi:hypothetical protein FI667_g11710, partial [Globisporangium splendens]